ncbi:cutinase family protein [Corynebacterium sp. CCM 9204]|uniref:cutinase family protein n=1 Tax=Corynebacterium sp. CCM 9204 TaxID=3057616 RepID=UPI0035233008
MATQTSATASEAAEPAQFDSEPEATETVAAVGDDNVGRTFIDFDAPRTGVFIPGVVTGPDTGEYDEAVVAAIDKTEGVLTDINDTYPDTQVIIIGYPQGTHVASAVGKKIGSGQGAIPADKVAGLAMFSEHTSSESQPTVANGASAPGTSGDNVSELGTSVGPPLTTVLRRRRLPVPVWRH